jgi:hypothetical protein
MTSSANASSRSFALLRDRTRLQQESGPNQGRRLQKMTDDRERKRMDEAKHYKERYAEDLSFRLKRNARSNAWGRANRERISARWHVRFQTEPEFRRRASLASFANNWRRRAGYDSSIIDIYERMFGAQQGRCRICQQKSERRLCLDHCAMTRRLRALLCHSCNTGLGLFRHNPISLRRAAAYVEAWRAIHKSMPPLSCCGPWPREQSAGQAVQLCLVAGSVVVE